MTPTDPLRQPWTALPAPLREQVEERLGGPVRDFQPATGGFSDGVVGGVYTRTASAFVKAVRQDDPIAADYLTEAGLTPHLPAAAGRAALRFAVHQHGWVLLCFELLPGRLPAEPWSWPDLTLVLDALTDLAAALDPAPVTGLPTISDRMFGRAHTWTDLVSTGHSGPLTLDALSDWERAHLDRLAQQEQTWPQQVHGSALLHFDLRHDNVLLQPNGRVRFLDGGERAPARAGSTSSACFCCPTSVRYSPTTCSRTTRSPLAAPPPASTRSSPPCPVTGDTPPRCHRRRTPLTYATANNAADTAACDGCKSDGQPARPTADLV